MLTDMTQEAATKLRLSSPADLVEAVPYLLGYHPSDSMVALALRGARRRVVFTMRMDLPQPDEGDIAGPLARNIVAHLAHAEADQAVLVVYANGTREPAGLPQIRLVEETTTALQRGRIDVVEALCVQDGRWWSYTCNRPTCCPTEGTAIPGLGASTVAATATYAGLVALPNREALEKMLDPIGFLNAHGMAQALSRAEEAMAARSTDRASLEAVRAESLTLLVDAVDTEADLSDDAAARLIVGLEDITVRDACCEWTETDRQQPAFRLWVQLSRRATPGFETVPLAMVAWFSWRSGDATLARIAVQRCLRSDASYSLALLLLEALDAAVNPATLVPARPVGPRQRSRRKRR